jgi:hypothetical protein
MTDKQIAELFMLKMTLPHTHNEAFFLATIRDSLHRPDTSELLDTQPVPCWCRVSIN